MKNDRHKTIDLAKKEVKTSARSKPKFHVWMGLLGLIIISSIAAFLPKNDSRAPSNTFTYKLGKNDNFATADGPEEVTYQRSEAKDWFENVLFKDKCNLPNYQVRCSMRQLDEVVNNRDFLHSFVFQDIFARRPSTKIVGATFKTKLKSLGSDNDGIRLTVFGDPTTNLSIESKKERHWYSRIPWLTNSNWSPGETVELELDLGNLPPTNNSNGNLLQAMQEGFLEVQIQDDTLVDYIELTIEVE